jgi:hypothetical protein
VYFHATGANLVVENGSEQTAGFLKSVISAFALVTAWVFVVGWSYLHAYYALFGLNIDSLDFPMYHNLVFCYAQFVSFSWSGLLVALLLIAFFLITWMGTETESKTWAVLISCVYLFLFWAGFRLAVRNGRTAAVHDMGVSSPLPEILLEFDKPVQYADTEEALASSHLRLLLETKDQVFVFVPIDTTARRAKISLLAIDRHEAPMTVRIVRIQ